MPITETKQTKKEIITARCDTRAKEILNLLSKTEHLSRSEIITKSILEYYRKYFLNRSLVEKEREFFGRFGSAKGDVSIKRKQYLKEILGGKHRHS